MINDLINLGFSHHEAEVYLALIDVGQTGAGEIIKKTGLHRNIVYETLDKLIAKKLVAKIFRKNIAQFQVTSPNHIVEEAKAKLELAESVIPDLVERADIKQEIVIWDGLEGFRKFMVKYMEEIEDGGVYYVLGSVGDRWWELMGDAAAKSYMRIKTKKHLSWKLVAFSDSALDRKSMDLSKNDLDEMRLLLQPSIPVANMTIWNDKIALVTFAPPYSVIEIRNKVLVDGYLTYFNTMWKQAKPIS